MSPLGPEPRARDLAYSLYRRSVHPELLGVTRAASLGKAHWKARVFLLDGSGHAVSFASAAGPVVQEVVSLRDLALPLGGRVDVRALARTPRDRVRLGGDLAYVCSYAVETTEKEEFVRRHAKILAGSSRRERVVLERGHPENDGPTPFSLLEYEPHEGLLETFAVHAFPRERTFVFVKSSFAPKPAKKR